MVQRVNFSLNVCPKESGGGGGDGLVKVINEYRDRLTDS